VHDHAAVKDGLVPIGEITIRPPRQRITGVGAITVLRASRLTHKGKTVTAQLALRLNDSLAGQILKAEVEASARTLGRRDGCERSGRSRSDGGLWGARTSSAFNLPSQVTGEAAELDAILVPLSTDAPR
jgi:hypothetical protein